MASTATTPQHAGDLPSLHANANGMAVVNYEEPTKSAWAAAPTHIANRALIVHADPDDYTSQPTGNAGARLACGVIQPQ